MFRLYVNVRSQIDGCEAVCEGRGEPCVKPWTDALEELSELYGEEEVAWLLGAWGRVLEKHGIEKGSATTEGAAWLAKAREYGELATEWEQRGQ